MCCLLVPLASVRWCAKCNKKSINDLMYKYFVNGAQNDSFFFIRHRSHAKKMIHLIASILLHNFIFVCTIRESMGNVKFYYKSKRVNLTQFGTHFGWKIEWICDTSVSRNWFHCQLWPSPKSQKGKIKLVNKILNNK